MKNYVFIIFLGLSFMWSCGSDDNSTENKVSDNKIIVKESEDKANKVEVDAKFNTFLSKFSRSSLPYNINPTGEEKYNKIPLKDQITYLSKAEKLSKSELEEMKDYTDFYYVSNPINTDKYHAIVYGRFEMGSVYYFLCTYDNSGALISNIDFAAYEMMTAGPQSGQEYYSKGAINKKYEVEVKTEEETQKFKIQDNGKIVKNN